MRVLAIADLPSDALWGPMVQERLEGIDLILSCGDLPRAYLEYLVTFTNAPLVYVPGNHDGAFAESPPEGCICADGKLVTVKGLRILGLGGSICYNAESAYQYTQQQMKRRVWRLWWPLHRKKGFDILLTHAGAVGMGDEDDRAHAGFEAFNQLIDRWRPPFFIHGHSHLNYSIKQKRLSWHDHTQIINAYERYVFDVEL